MNLSAISNKIRSKNSKEKPAKRPICALLKTKSTTKQNKESNEKKL